MPYMERLGTLRYDPLPDSRHWAIVPHLPRLRTAHMENDPLGSEQLRCAVLDLAVPMPTALQVSTVHRKDMDRVAREVTLHVRVPFPAGTSYRGFFP